MAEIAITLNWSKQLENGDVHRAWNRGHILAEHAYLITHARNQKTRRFTRCMSNGLLALHDPMRDWYEQTHEYSITRISKTQAVKRRISDGAEIVVVSEKLYTDFDGKENCSMHVPMLFDRQVETLVGPGGRGCPCFGDPSTPTFYYGKKRIDTPKAEAIWSSLESKLGVDRRDAQYKHYPAGHTDLSRRLHIVVDEFSDEEQVDLMAPQMDTRNEMEPVVLKERRHNIDWKHTLDLSGKQIEDIENKNLIVDLREILPVKTRANIVVSKGLDLKAGGPITIER